MGNGKAEEVLSRTYGHEWGEGVCVGECCGGERVQDRGGQRGEKNGTVVIA